MEFNGQDFKELLFPCFDLKDGMDLFELFPVLKIYPEFKLEIALLSRVKVFKYINFLYDKKSPLRSIDDFTKRSIEASQLAKFPIDDETNKYTEPYMEVLRDENNAILKMSLRFCRIQGSMAFSQLVIMEEIYYKELEQLKSMTDSKARKESIVNISTLRREIEDLKRSLLADSNSKALELLLFKEIEGESLGISPEEIANLYYKGKNISDYSKYAQKDPIQV